ncbi:YchJ family metal-binding protein [Pseudovibrio sp. Tun.PSC04-5.I4]|uniref:YchJ family protein n=1 Tax=Pseudovibrio sp. Tun.PSC04-5.I4 TaxID=1798213 RepID=UPI00088EF54B|nr:YchJ family metal-binding protein [Pseudovibrio sp. Tun.PSC04-5.I4]SDR28556.1 SEC-C motif-containing protein [Pseudovibrio sp. Tun.PSC04-5.I4]
MPTPCPCQSGKDFEACCQPFLEGKALPETAEQLMRSRYSAYATKTIGYLKETLWPRYQKSFSPIEIAEYAEQTQWLGLEILATQKGQAGDAKGSVLFCAKYLAHGKFGEQRELSLFKKRGGRWYYVEPLEEGARL